MGSGLLDCCWWWTYNKPCSIISPMKYPHCGKTIPKKLIVAESGRIGGKTTAKRGPEYYRQLQEKRKTKSGGRPPKIAS